MRQPATRVLLVSHGHPSLSPGGGEIVAYELYKNLKDHESVEPFFLGAMLPRFGAPHCGSAIRPVGKDAGETLYWTDQYNYFLMAQDNLALMLEEFGRYLEAVRPAVVHFHHVHNLGVEMIQIVKNHFPNARIFVTLHEYLPICFHNGQMVKTKTLALCHGASAMDCNRCFPEISTGEFYFRERFIKSHFDLVDEFFCPSLFLMERYAAWGIPKAKLRYVENGHVAANQEKEITAPPRKNVFGYFGQVSPYKGLGVLLDAVKHLLNRDFTEFRVDVFGTMLFLSDEQGMELRKRISEVESHVLAHGAYQPEDVVGLMTSVDWVVVPSIWWENAPLVIQEAFIARRPVICSNIGGMAEKVDHNVNGLHFRVGDPIALAETILRSCGETGLCETLSNGIRPVRSMRACAEEHLALYTAKGTERINRKPRRTRSEKQSHSGEETISL